MFTSFDQQIQLNKPYYSDGKQLFIQSSTNNGSNNPIRLMTNSLVSRNMKVNKILIFDNFFRKLI